MANVFFTALTATIVLFAVHQVYTNPHNQRVLSPEEEALAEEARATVVNVLEKNLIKFFTLVSADSGRELYSRQDEEDDDEYRVPTLNPHILPQVAQILGAIFAGNLNLTAVLDTGLNLGTGLLRNQIEGIFKVLGNQQQQQQQVQQAATAAPATTAQPSRRRRTTTEEIFPEDYDVVTEKVTRRRRTTTTTTTAKPVNKNANRGNSSLISAEVDDFEEDSDLYRLQEELVAAAKDAEPYVRDKQPRFFVSSFNEIMRNFDNGRLNLTQIIRFLPDLFQGARHAFTLLENLGKIAGVDLDAEDDSE